MADPARPSEVLGSSRRALNGSRLVATPVDFLFELVGQLSNRRLVVESRGEVDIAIGTHALLSQQVKFKNLGLLIIDEEQHFGVQHK